jgi:peptide/nickel transport system substrate-binding protein
MGEPNLTRRGLLARGVATIGAGACLATILRAGRARAAATQTLTVGTNIPFTTLDPNTINTSVFPFRNSVFDPLIDIPVVDTAKYQLGDIQTMLATDYKVNNDYTEIRMAIRDGVRFHDGSPITADTVATSLEYAIDPEDGRDHGRESGRYRLRRCRRERGGYENAGPQRGCALSSDLVPRAGAERLCP